MVGLNRKGVHIEGRLKRKSKNEKRRGNIRRMPKQRAYLVKFLYLKTDYCLVNMIYTAAKRARIEKVMEEPPDVVGDTVCPVVAVTPVVSVTFDPVVGVTLGPAVDVEIGPAVDVEIGPAVDVEIPLFGDTFGPTQPLLLQQHPESPPSIVAQELDRFKASQTAVGSQV